MPVEQSVLDTVTTKKAFPSVSSQSVSVDVRKLEKTVREFCKSIWTASASRKKQEIRGLLSLSTQQVCVEFTKTNLILLLRHYPVRGERFQNRPF